MKETDAKTAEAPAAEGELNLKTEEGTVAAEAPPSFFKRYKKFVIVIAAILILAVAALVFTKYFHVAAAPEPVKKEEVAHDGGVPGVPKDYYFDLPELSTNLTNSTGQDSYIRLKLTLQLTNAADQATIDAKLPMLKDTISIFLRELRAADLNSSGGSIMLKAEILKRINKILAPVAAKAVLFKEIMVE